MRKVILFLCFTILCMTDDISNGLKNINSFETAFDIMNARKSAGKSLCLSHQYGIRNDTMEIRVVLARIMGKQTNDQSVDLATGEFIDEYSRSLNDGEDVDKFIREFFLDKDCQTHEINKYDIAQQVISEFSTGRSNMLKLNSSQVLAYSCEVEILYIEQSYYNESDTKGKEQMIADFSYFIYRTTQEMAEIDYSGIGYVLTRNTVFLFRRISNTQNSPDKHVLKCFLRKSEASYKLDKLNKIGRISKIIINNLSENETCYIGKLPKDRQLYISSLFAETTYGKFDEVDRKIIVDSFETLFYDLEYSNIFNMPGFYEYLKEFINFTTCNFNKDRLSSDFLVQIPRIRDHVLGNTHINRFGQTISIFCVLLELRNTPLREFNNDLKNSLIKIMDLYTFYLNGLRGDIEEKFTSFIFKHMNTVRRDSSRIDRILIESDYYKIQYACILRRSQSTFENRFQPVLRKLKSFINTEYAPLHCQNKVFEERDFINGVMKLLLGVIDYDLISFNFIFKSTVEILDQSSISKELPWTEFIHYDGHSCSVQKNIDYKNLKLDQSPKSTTNFNSLKESIVNRCSSIYSIAEALKENQQSHILQDKALIYSAYIYLSRTSTQFRSLETEEKAKAIKSYIGRKALSFKEGIGRKGILECEILRVATIGSHYEYSLFVSLYSLVAATYYDNTSCSYMPDTFNDRNLQDISSILMSYPELKDSSVSDITTYIIPSLKIIFTEYDLLFSTFKMPPEFTTQLVNERTCILNEIDDAKLSNEIDKFLATADITNFPRVSPLTVRFCNCHAFRDIKSTISKLEDKKKLSFNDISVLNGLLDKEIQDNPLLKNRTISNFKTLFMAITRTEKFNFLVDNSLKLSLAECNLRNLYLRSDSSSDGNSGSGHNSGASDNSGTTGVGDTNPGKNKLGSGAIAGIVIGTLLVVGILAGGTIYYIRVRRKSY